MIKPLMFMADADGGSGKRPRQGHGEDAQALQGKGIGKRSRFAKACHCTLGWALPLAKPHTIPSISTALGGVLPAASRVSSATGGLGMPDC